MTNAKLVEHVYSNGEPLLLNAKETLELVDDTIEHCGRSGMCEFCPILVDENSGSCAEYLIGIILSADWTGWEVDMNGVYKAGISEE